MRYRQGEKMFFETFFKIFLPINHLIISTCFNRVFYSQRSVLAKKSY